MVVPKRRNLLTRRVAAWLGIAAAPTFAAMAIITSLPGGERMVTICGVESSFLGGMVPMYLLMSVFHLTPWLKLIGQSIQPQEKEANGMKIGVIGIGEMGGTLARRWCEKGHTVRVANSRGLLAVKHFADSIGAEAADVHGALEDADVVVHAMAFPVAATLPKDIYDSAAGDVVIIDTSNYYPDVRDPRIPEIDEGMPESIWTSRQLGRPIFKAFNSIMFYALSELGKPEGSSNRLAIPVAGDDPRGKSVVMSLINDMGFDPVDGGLLEESWRQQPSTPAYCCDYDAETTLRGIHAAIKGKAEKIRDTEWREKYDRLFADKPAYADVHAAVIEMNRSFNPLPDPRRI